MDNAHKKPFFGLELYSPITYLIFSSLEPNTWKHVLSKCIQQKHNTYMFLGLKNMTKKKYSNLKNLGLLNP
jgi:hypothetical protein